MIVTLGVHHDVGIQSVPQPNVESDSYNQRWNHVTRRGHLRQGIFYKALSSPFIQPIKKATTLSTIFIGSIEPDCSKGQNRGLKS